jgi:BlaI family penicillinase repressor
MKTKTIPRISETEWEIMRVVWKHHPITAAEIMDHLSRGSDEWHPKTTRTLVARLVAKGALGYERRGREFAYAPKVKEKECVVAAADSFVDRVFGGALKPMLLHFVERRHLSKADLDELRRKLEGK